MMLNDYVKDYMVAKRSIYSDKFTPKLRLLCDINDISDISDHT